MSAPSAAELANGLDSEPQQKSERDESTRSDHENISDDFDYPEERNDTNASEANDSVGSESKRDGSRLSQVPQLLDFKFGKFWTPTIIRMSWFWTLMLAIAWILFISLIFVTSFFSGSDSDGLNADSLNLNQPASSRKANQELDINKVLDGEQSIYGLGGGGLEGLLSGLSGKHGMGSSKEKTTAQKFQGFIFKTLTFVTTIATLVLSVLWLRVLFEAVMVLFDISSRLKSIDEKTRDDL